MKIRFNEQLVDIRQHPEQQNYWCLNDLHRASGSEEKHKPGHFMKRKGVSKMTRLTATRLPEGETRAITETYVEKRGVYKYAAWVDDDFYDVVFNTFEAAASGDANKAVDIAVSAVIDPALIEREANLREVFNQLVKENMPEDKQKFAFMNYNRLMGKCFSGFTPKQLTDSRMSAFKYAVHLGHTDGVGAYLACLEMSIAALASGVDYHTLALMLKVETSKNKKLLKLLK